MRLHTIHQLSVVIQTPGMSNKLKIRRTVSVFLPSHSADQDLGTTSPILYLRSNLWQILEPHRKVLNVDLFWPDDLDRVKARDDEQDLASTESERTAIFPYDGLKPLLLFRNLHTLTLNGMQRSYQRLIWATCWLNPKLTTLSLEMALEPLMNISSDVFQRKVDHTWSLPSAAAEGEETEYLGYHGTGVLHEEFGDGEYLDTQAIKLAQLEVAENIPETNMRYLPVVKLTLMNVVIDNGPILRWFDPEKLEELNLKDGCIDAGLYLADEMPKVRVLSPRPPKPICIAKAVRPGEAKLVELRNGKVVSRTEAKSVEHELYIKEHPLRHKFSQLLPKLSRAT